MSKLKWLHWLCVCVCTQWRSVTSTHQNKVVHRLLYLYFEFIVLAVPSFFVGSFVHSFDAFCYCCRYCCCRWWLDILVSLYVHVHNIFFYFLSLSLQVSFSFSKSSLWHIGLKHFYFLFIQRIYCLLLYKVMCVENKPPQTMEGEKKVVSVLMVSVAAFFCPQISAINFCYVRMYVKICCHKKLSAFYLCVHVRCPIGGVDDDHDSDYQNDCVYKCADCTISK